jgi:hypothetical protein
MAIGVGLLTKPIGFLGGKSHIKMFEYHVHAGIAQQDFLS